MSLCNNNLICQCFFTNNYFVKKLGLHVYFLNRTDFLATNSELEEEYSRRRSVAKASLHRKEFIKLNYEPLYKNIYSLQTVSRNMYLEPAIWQCTREREKLHQVEKMLAPEFLELAQLCRQSGATLNDILSYMDLVAGAERVYRMPVFTTEFCEMFIKELKHFEASGMPVGRPNTMNHHGILLEELGMDGNFFTPLREAYLTPISRIIFPELLGPSNHCKDNSTCLGILDSHRAFVVVYSCDDLDLDLHYDDAEVTLNVALNNNYSEGSLYFTPTLQMSHAEFVPCKHKATHGVLHRGQHRHGALPIEESQIINDALSDSVREMERYNLIIWMRSSQIRSQCCPLCKEKPRLIRVEGTGAGFTVDCDITGTSAGFTGDCDIAGTSAGFTSDCDTTVTSAGFTGDCDITGTSADFATDISRTDKDLSVDITGTDACFAVDMTGADCTGDSEIADIPVASVKLDECNSMPSLLQDNSEQDSELQDSIYPRYDDVEVVQVCNVV